jgi:hypothetical protein
MAQATYTPIQLYFSTTAAAIPTSRNLANGELAINIQDEKLYFKNAAGTVKLLASNATSAPVLSFSAGTTGFTPSTATTGAITLAGTLIVGNGGTGAATLTGYVKGSGTSALTASATIPNTDITGLGTMSTQSANSVAITGGAVDGTAIGGTTAAAGSFTTVTATGGISRGTF